MDPAELLPSSAATSFRVGLLLQTGQAYTRDVSRGVFQFLRANRHWRVVGEGHHPLLQWDELADWQGDGLIAVPNTKEQMDALLAARVPVVMAGSRFYHPRLTTVASDSEAIGRLAAEHLLACRLKHFLFVGELAWENEQRRYRAFAATIANAGYTCGLLKLPVDEHIASDGSARYRPDIERLAEGLRSLPKPAGVCAPNSMLARFVVETARQCGYEVPDQIAALGVSDDPLVCESTTPHLTAVVQPSERIGLEAAKRLDGMMRGRPAAAGDVLLPPLGIAARRSTDTLAIEDEDVREALKFIRDRAHDTIEVPDVADAVGLSRRTLEHRFQKAIGQSPAESLRSARIGIAKKLLIETNDSLTHIVYASGFNNRQAFSTLFRKETGVTPSDFRKEYQSDVFVESSARHNS